MPILSNPKHEAFAQGVARGSPAAAAYIEAGYEENRHNAATLARKQHIFTRVRELQEEQLAIHQQATAQAAVNAQVTIESLIAEAEAARAKAMEEKGGAAAAVSARIAKAKLAGVWREKNDQHNTCTGTVNTIWNVSGIMRGTVRWTRSGLKSKRPREQFRSFHNRKQRWSVLVCHRRAGKTVATLNDLI
jgi:hypothetical protein